LLAQELPMPFDLSTVNWTFVGLMTLLAFVAALLGGLIAFRNPLVSVRRVLESCESVVIQERWP
jgi:hypothetical protein